MFQLYYKAMVKIFKKKRRIKSHRMCYTIFSKIMETSVKVVAYADMARSMHDDVKITTKI